MTKPGSTGGDRPTHLRMAPTDRIPTDRIPTDRSQTDRSQTVRSSEGSRR